MLTRLLLLSTAFILIVVSCTRENATVATPYPAYTSVSPTVTTTPTPIIWKVFTHDSDSFSISVPSNWEVEMDLDLLSLQNPTIGVATLFFAVDESSGNNVMVFVDIRELLEFEPQPIDINQYVEFQIDSLQESVGMATAINKIDVVVDGITTTQLRMNKSGIELIMNILVSNEPYALCGSMPFIIQGTASSEDISTIENALESFKVLPTITTGIDCADRRSLSLASEPQNE